MIIFLELKSGGKQINVDRMKDIAKNYYNASQKLEGDYSQHYGYSTIILQILCVEILMKYLIIRDNYEDGQIVTDKDIFTCHSIKWLANKLKSDVAEEIVRRLGQEVYDEVVEEYDKAFLELRYSYELYEKEVDQKMHYASKPIMINKDLDSLLNVLFDISNAGF